MSDEKPYKRFGPPDGEPPWWLWALALIVLAAIIMGAMGKL